MFSPFGTGILKTEEKEGTQTLAPDLMDTKFFNAERNCKRLHMKLVQFPCVKAARLCDTLICLPFLNYIVPKAPPGQAKTKLFQFLSSYMVL